MLPPQPLPEVPQDPEPLPARLAGCFLALFCFGWDFWFWSCGLLLRSNVCVQPRVTGNSEQKSARRKRFFFTGPPLSESPEGTRGPGSTALLGFSESSMPDWRQQLCSHVVWRCDFPAKGFLANETHRKSPNSENPDTTWQTPLLLLESKSLLEQNCYRLAASH